MPYEIRLVDISGYYQECFFCNKPRCGGCALSCSDKFVVGDLLKAAKLESNNTLYSADRFYVGKEVQLEVIWHHALD